MYIQNRFCFLCHVVYYEKGAPVVVKTPSSNTYIWNVLATTVQLTFSHKTSQRQRQEIGLLRTDKWNITPKPDMIFIPFITDLKQAKLVHW